MTDKLKELLREAVGMVNGATQDWHDRAQAALSEPAVEAAEIEVVDVIGYFNPDNLARVKADEISGFMLHDEESERINTAAMTVAQHRRILAGVNQQAGSGWIACAERMPESGRTVLAHYLNSFGNDRRIRAQHVKAWTILAEDHADPDTECVEYSEQEDAYYLLEGWYECIDNWDEYYRVQVNEGPITHWQPLPPSPAAKAGEA